MPPHLQALSGVLLWNAVGIVLASAFFPLARRQFSTSVAWGLSRLLAPWILAWTALSPTLILNQTRFSPATVGFTFSLFAVLSAWLEWKFRRPLETEERSSILRFEGLAVGSSLLFALFIPYIASTVGYGERLRDTALWTALHLHRIYPLQDPWFAGEALRYYAFGYYSLATTAFFLPLSPLFTYNLALVAVMSAYVSGLFLVLRSFQFRYRTAIAGSLALALGSSLAASFAVVKSFGGVPYDWWQISRVIPNTINEFPLWTFSLGDLHPHFIAMPLLGALITVLAEKRSTSLILGAFLAAIAWGTNSWEAPIFLGFVALAGYKNLRTLAIGMGLAGLVARPFLRWSSLMPMHLAWVREGSSAVEILKVFGLFLIPTLIATGISSRPKKPMAWALAGLAVALGFNNGFGMVAASLALLILSAEKWELADWLPIAGLSLILIGETLYLEDVFKTSAPRLNTIFKLYVPAWTLLGLSAVIALRRLPYTRYAIPIWALLLSGHLAMGLSSRTGGFQFRQDLNGLSSFKLQFPDDADLIQKMRETHFDSPTLLEAVGNGYSNHSRFSATTGMASYHGWTGTGLFLIAYGNRATEVTSKRIEIADKIYQGNYSDCGELHTLLHQERIDLVAVGALEKQRYPTPSLEKLRSCLAIRLVSGTSYLLGTSERSLSSESSVR